MIPVVLYLEEGKRIMPQLMNMNIRTELEWKANLDSFPINTKMEVETPSTKEKTQKISIDEQKTQLWRMHHQPRKTNLRSRLRKRLRSN